MPRSKSKNLSVIILLSLLIFSGHPASAGFGISPPNITEKAIEPGVKIAKWITVLRSDSERREEVRITVFAPGFRDWLDFGQSSWQFEKGSTRRDLVLNIKVPKAAKEKNYKGYLHIKLVPDESQGSIALGAKITIDLSVKAKKKSKNIGRLYLQTQSKGELWYINPADNRKYPIQSAIDLKQLVSESALGVKHNIISGGRTEKLSGRLLIDTQDKGKLYYIDTTDHKAHFISLAGDGWKELAEFAIGIKDFDLDKIK